MCGSRPDTVLNIAEPVLQRNFGVAIIASKILLLSTWGKSANRGLLLAFNNQCRGTAMGFHMSNRKPRDMNYDVCVWGGATTEIHR